MHSILRKFATLVTAAVLSVSALGAGALPVSAYTSTCTQTIGTGTLYVKLFEGDNYQPAGGTAAILCIRASGTGSTNVPDLNNVAYESQGDSICNGQLIQDYGNWNDCASSIQSQFSDCHHVITVYSSENYTGAYTRQSTGPSPSWSATQNIPDLGGVGVSWTPSAQNSISSLKVTYHAVCQSIAVQ